MLFGEELMENTLMAKGCRTFLTGWRGDHFISRRGYSAYSELLKQGKFSKFIKAVWGTSEFLGRRPLRMLRSIAISNIPEKYLMSTEFPGVSLLNPGWVKESNLVERQGHNTRPTWGINDVNWDIIKRLPTYDGAHQYYEDLSFRHNQILIRLNPLSDPRVINFTLKLPAEEFVKEGMDRSIMRRAIKNIVPDELRLRRTKGSFMGDESEICSRLHYEWLRRIDVPKLIDHTPFAPFINVDALLKQLKIHKDKLEKGNYVFDHEGTYFLNLLGYFLYFENS